jgi:hypothetical protein
MIRDGNPSPEQARKMAKVFVIATLVGGLLVFLNVTMRSYSIRMQQAELKSKQQTSGETAAPATTTTPDPQEQTPPAPTTTP